MVNYFRVFLSWLKNIPLPQKYNIDIEIANREFQKEVLEKFYINKQTKENNARSEVSLTDKETGFKCRVDCITDTHAIEVEFAQKFYESVGQSLVYSTITGKKPGIVLILTTPSDIRFYKMLEKMILNKSLDIDIFPYGPLIDVVKIH